MTEEQTKVSLRTEKIRANGALWILNPAGSTYKDPDTKQIVTRIENSLQYARSGIPQKYQFGKADIENFIEFFNSDKGKAFILTLPDEPTLEPNSV